MNNPCLEIFPVFLGMETLGLFWKNIITSEQSPARYVLENKIKMTIIFAVISER